ncbi:MAG: hypothetical protein AB3N24_03545 [Leisingera sp.]
MATDLSQESTIGAFASRRRIEFKASATKARALVVAFAKTHPS